MDGILFGDTVFSVSNVSTLTCGVIVTGRFLDIPADALASVCSGLTVGILVGILPGDIVFRVPTVSTLTCGVIVTGRFLDIPADALASVCSGINGRKSRRYFTR